MPYHVSETHSPEAALNDRKKSIKGSKILILGMAYKKDVDDLRESPSLKPCSNCSPLAAPCSIYNLIPYFAALHKMRHYDFFQHALRRPSSLERLAGYDCVLIATDHLPAYDYEAVIARDAKLVVDTRETPPGA